MKPFTSLVHFIIYLVGMLLLPFFRAARHVYKIYLSQRERYRFKSCGEKLSLASPVYMSDEKYMTIGRNFKAKPGLRMTCIGKYNKVRYTPELIIGDNVSVNYYCHIGCLNRIVIGDNVMMGSYVLIEDHAHGKEPSETPVAQRELYSKGPIIIEDNVWIGDHACILAGVTIGRCSIIGANAVVTRDIPPYSVAVGAPAKVVKRQ